MVKIYKIIFSLFLFGLIPLSVNAATLSFSQPDASYGVGQTFSVNVYVGSPDQAMNAASGIVSFPWDKLEVVSISKTGSIFSLWVQEPTFSNRAGTINFEGIVLNPGFKGTNGKVLTITFKTKITGQANLSFSSGSVLANDGTGTNILDNLRVAVINISNTEPEVPIAPTEAASEDNAPLIISLTHPDQTKWYTNKNPEFSWDLPKGALEVRTLIGTSPNSAPNISYIPSIKSKKIENLSDGVYYFHLQIRTASGWGGVAHYRINIDTTPPKPFSITFPHGSKSLEPQPVILFNTIDDGSGISHYNIKIGNGGLERTAPMAKSNPYPLPVQRPGEHTVIVSAIDGAGNSTSASADFTIEAIESPIITYYTEEISVGDIVKIRGTTYPNSDIKIIIKEEDKIKSEELTRSNILGDFSLVATKRLTPGVYTFTVYVVDERGAQSNETSPLTIVVNSAFLNELIGLVLNYLSVAILFVLAVGAILIGGVYVWRHSILIVHRLKKESREAEKVLEKSFKILRKDIDEHITKLKKAQSKRKLTAEEIDFLERFEEELSEAEDVITKEIQDISNT